MVWNYRVTEIVEGYMRVVSLIFRACPLIFLFRGMPTRRGIVVYRVNSSLERSLQRFVNSWECAGVMINWAVCQNKAMGGFFATFCIAVTKT